MKHLYEATLLSILVVQINSITWSANDLKRCPPTVPRSRFVKAAPEWNKCYEFRMEKRTWRSAYHSCGGRKGRLVTIRERRIQNFLVKSMRYMRFNRDSVWIGATDKRSEMDWKWITGERVDKGYNNWARNQPSCSWLCMEDCAVMRWTEGTGKWHDYHCSLMENHAFICEYDMIPEKPATTTTTSTTTSSTSQSTSTTTTTSTSTSPSTTPTTASSSPTPIEETTKSLSSAYLVHSGDVSSNETLIVIVQPSLGSDNNQVASLAESNKSSGSGFHIAFLVLGILLGLASGLCIFAVFMRRRRRKDLSEDDPRVSYFNPYYGEVHARVHTGCEQSEQGEGLLEPPANAAAAFGGRAGDEYEGACAKNDGDKFSALEARETSRRENDYSSASFLNRRQMYMDDGDSDKWSDPENIYESLENVRAAVAELERRDQLSRADS